MPLNEAQKRLLAWCREELKSNHDQLELLESGIMHTRVNRGDGWVDTTQSEIADLKRRSAGLEDIVAAYEQQDGRRE